MLWFVVREVGSIDCGRGWRTLWVPFLSLILNLKIIIKNKKIREQTKCNNYIVFMEMMMSTAWGLEALASIYKLYTCTRTRCIANQMLKRINGP